MKEGTEISNGGCSVPLKVHGCDRDGKFAPKYVSLFEFRGDNGGGDISTAREKKQEGRQEHERV